MNYRAVHHTAQQKYRLPEHSLGETFTQNYHTGTVNMDNNPQLNEADAKSKRKAKIYAAMKQTNQTSK